LSNKEKKILLAKYRLQQAKESVEEAAYLMDGEMSPRSIINRAYYAMFYAVMALLIFEQFISSKHTGVLSFFNRQFIKEGIFPKEMGRWINKAFEMRQSGDYKEYSDLSHDQVAPYIEYARTFIRQIDDYLEKNFFNIAAENDNSGSE
jgi:uncharacterized protein (UPF0332 family)